MTDADRRARVRKLALGAACAALAVAVRLAHATPARGYELSPYAATPTAFWIGVAVATAAGLVVATGAPRGGIRTGGLTVASASVLSIVLLPVIRGYRAFGAGDSLTHFGWIRDVAAGALSPTELLYPGVHATVLLGEGVLATGYQRLMMLTVAAYVLVFVLFSARCVDVVGRHHLAAPVGVAAGLLLLPINNVSLHLVMHPITQSALLFPFLLYLTFRYVRIRPAGDYKLGGTGILLAVGSTAIVLVHPQGAVNVLLAFVGVLGLQFVARRVRPEWTHDGHRLLFWPPIVLAGAIALWLPGHERVTASATGVVQGIAGGAPAGDEIAVRASSLATVGGSIEELFVKLFLSSAVFAVLAGLLTLGAVLGRLDDRYAERNALVVYLGAATVPLVAELTVFFLSSTTTQHFRYLGFAMVPATVLGAVALSDGPHELPWTLSTGHARLVLLGVFALALPLAMASAHASPFIYQENSQVTDDYLTGYETAFEQRADDVAYVGIRSGPDRYVDAVYGTERGRSVTILDRSAAVPPPVFRTNLSEHYEDDRYLPVTSRSVRREVVMYDGLRYPRSGFESLQRSPEIYRVQSNGGFNLYYLDNEPQ